MPALVKDPITTYIPGDPGNPGSPYVPPQPARTVVEDVTVCGWDTQFNTSLEGVILNAAAPVYSCTVESQIVYYPATAGTPSVPYSPPTAAQISVSLNEGWNSYARTIAALPPGSRVEYTVKPGTHGALVAIGAPGMEGVAIDLFGHGIMVDSTGIYVFENGVVGTQLSATNLSGTTIRILRLADGRIAYDVGGNVSISATPTSVFDTLHVYGMLYAAYDEVSTTALLTGAAVGEPSAAMGGAGSFTMRPQGRALMAGYGDLLVSVNGPAVVMAGTGDFLATLSQAAELPATTLAGAGAFAAVLESGGRGYVTLEAMQAFGSDVGSTAYGIGSTSLPLFAASASGGSFIPAQPTNGYVNLPFFTAWAGGVEISAGNGDVSLPLFIAQASEGDYGIGNARLPLFVAAAYGGFSAADELVLMSAGVARSQQAQALDLVLILNSDGTLSSSLTLTREQALALMSSLSQSSSFSMLGTFGMTVTSDLRVASLQALNVANRPDLFDGGAVWVVNLDTSASAQYQGYGFNSFFQRGSDYYGVANDGIYKLAGADDAGIPIAALVEFARSNLGTTHSKHVPEIYLAAASGGALMLKVVTEGSTHYYTARSSSADLRNHLVKPGKGLNSVYWQFALMNQAGDDFNVAGIEFVPAVSKRRI